MSTTPIRPPVTHETALAKGQAAEDAWNRRFASINDAPIREGERRAGADRPAAPTGGGR